MRRFVHLALALAGLITFGAVQDAVAQDVSVHGFASQGYLRSSTNNFLGGNTEDGSAEYQEFAFNISSQIQDDLRVGVQFFARDLGPLGNNEIELDWAFGDYHWQDELGFRAGRFKMPYGFYNETADFDAARTSILMPTGVYDQRFRDLLVAVNGLQTYGHVNLFQGTGGGLDYTAFFGTTGLPDDGSVDRTFDAEYNALPNPAMGGLSTGTNLQNASVNNVAGGSLQWETPLDGLRIGGSMVNYDAEFNFAFNDPRLGGLYQANGGPALLNFSTKNTNFSVFGAEYTYGDFVFAAESSIWKGNFNSNAPTIVAQVDANMFDPGVPPGTATVDVPIAVDGDKINYSSWYAQGSYRVNDWLEVGSYYSIFYATEDKSTDDANDYQQDITISTRFDVSYAMTVKLEAHFIEGYGQILSDLNPTLIGDRSGLDESWTMFAAKTSFVF